MSQTQPTIIPGLFSLHEAVEILDEARDALSDEYCSKDDITNFYQILHKVQTFNYTQCQSDSNYKPKVIVVEVFIQQINHSFYLRNLRDWMVVVKVPKPSCWRLNLSEPS